MAKYDAFGREIGEDTLSGLGGGSPVEVHEPAAARVEPTPGPKPKPAPRRRRGRPGVTFVVLLVMIGAAIEGFATGGDGDEGAVDPGSLAPAVVDSGAGAGEGAGEGVTPNAEGVTPPSLIGAQQFGGALAALRSSELGRLTHLRVARDRIDAQMLTRNRKINVVQVSPSLEVRRLATTDAVGLDSFGFGVVRPRAPSRLAREASRKLGVPRSEVDYLLFSRFGGDLQWAAYFRDGRHAVGNVDGRLRRVF